MPEIGFVAAARENDVGTDTDVQRELGTRKEFQCKLVCFTIQSAVSHSLPSKIHHLVMQKGKDCFAVLVDRFLDRPFLMGSIIREVDLSLLVVLLGWRKRSYETSVGRSRGRSSGCSRGCSSGRRRRLRRL